MRRVWTLLVLAALSISSGCAGRFTGDDLFRGPMAILVVPIAVVATPFAVAKEFQKNQDPAERIRTCWANVSAVGQSIFGGSAQAERLAKHCRALEAEAQPQATSPASEVPEPSGDAPQEGPENPSP